MIRSLFKIVILLSSLFSVSCNPGDGKGGRFIDSVIANTPHDSSYTELSNDIEAMGKRPWNKYDYSRIKQSISDRMSGSEANELNGLLSSAYCLVLKDSIFNYCRMSKSYDPVLSREFKEELEKLPAKYDKNKMDLSSDLDALGSAFSIEQQVKHYLEYERYSKEKNSTYSRQIETFQNMEEVNSNPAVVQIKNSCKNYLAHFSTNSTKFDNSMKQYKSNIKEIIKKFNDNPKLKEVECTTDGILNQVYLKDLNGLLQK